MHAYILPSSRPPSFSLAFSSALLAQAPYPSSSAGLVLPIVDSFSSGARLGMVRIRPHVRVCSQIGRGGVYEAYPTSSLRPCPRPRTLLPLSAPALVLVHPQTEILLTWTPTRLPSSSAHCAAPPCIDPMAYHLFRTRDPLPRPTALQACRRVLAAADVVLPMQVAQAWSHHGRCCASRVSNGGGGDNRHVACMLG